MLLMCSTALSANRMPPAPLPRRSGADKALSSLSSIPRLNNFSLVQHNCRFAPTTPVLTINPPSRQSGHGWELLDEQALFVHAHSFSDGGSLTGVARLGAHREIGLGWVGSTAVTALGAGSLNV